MSNLYYFCISFAPTETAFVNEQVPRISIEAGCQVSRVGRRVEELAAFCVSSCPYFPNTKVWRALRAQCVTPKKQLLILLRLLCMTSFE